MLFFGWQPPWLTRQCVRTQEIRKQLQSMRKNLLIPPENWSGISQGIDEKVQSIIASVSCSFLSLFSTCSFKNHVHFLIFKSISLSSWPLKGQFTQITTYLITRPCDIRSRRCCSFCNSGCTLFFIEAVVHRSVAEINAGIISSYLGRKSRKSQHKNVKVSEI